jgi:mRNA interferase RelE/StbE
LAWKIEITDSALKQLDKLDKPLKKRLYSFMQERLALLDDPRVIGEALKGSTLGEFWKYRVGDYRIIASIQDSVLQILVVRIGNRREVYRVR